MSASSRKSLLFFTTELPWPPNSGGRIKSFKLIQALSERFDVRVLCAHGGNRPDHALELRKNSGIVSLQCFESHRPRTAWHWFIALMKFPTFNAYRIYTRELEAMLRWVVERSDLVIADHLETLEMLPERHLAKVVYHSHNAEFRLWESHAALELNPLKKVFIGWEAERVKAFERWGLKKVKWSFAAPNDITVLCAAFQLQSGRFKETFHLGNDELLDLPELDLNRSPKQVFFAGTLSWMPNRDGILWFVKSCWPSIRQAHQEAVLCVCGAGADPELQQLLRQTTGVEFHGFVEDLEDVMSSCRCAIVPLRYGSGMKIKTLDAMYRGLPLVATTVGTESISIEPTKHALVHDDAASFAESVNVLLNDTERGANMAAAARLLASQRYRYAPLLKNMCDSILSEWPEQPQA